MALSAAMASVEPAKRKCPSKACYCGALTVWLALAFLVFLVTSFLYVGRLVRSVRYRSTLCRIENTFFTTQFICHCGADCKSSYPCLLVHVSLNISDGQLWTVSLYQDELQQEGVIGLDHDKQEWCSLKVCDPEALINHRTVEAFHDRYGHQGDTLLCSYDPWDIRAGAVISVTPLTMAIFHALFWPFLGIVVGVSLCVVFCRRCQQEDAQKEVTGCSGLDAIQLTKMEEGDPDSKAQNAEGKSGRFKKYRAAKSFDIENRTRKKGFFKSKSLFM